MGPHQTKDCPADLLLKVSKLINNVGSMLNHLLFQLNLTRLVMDSNKNLKKSPDENTLHQQGVCHNKRS